MAMTAEQSCRQSLQGRRHGSNIYRTSSDTRADRRHSDQEDADAIGISILSGAHEYCFKAIIDLLKERTQAT